VQSEQVWAVAIIMMASMQMLFFFATFVGVAQSVSPVQKVLSLIDEMAGKVKGDLDTAVSEFQEVSQFAAKTATEKSYALKSSAEDVEALNAAILDAQSTIASHETIIADLSNKISAAEGDLDKAVALREKEHEDFVVAEKDLVTNVEQITFVIEGAASFAQMEPDAKKKLQALTNGLGSVADAAFVMHGPNAKVAAFLQAEDEDGSGDDVLGVVKERAEAALSGARRNEQEAAGSHGSLKMGLENEIKGMNKELKQSTKGKAVAAEELAQAQKELALEKSAQAKDQTFMQEMKRDYDAQARDFEVEHRDATAELKALGQATAILKKKFASFLEAGARTKARFAVRFNDDQKVRALRAIQQLGQRLHSTALVSLAYRAAADPFVKVRGMVEDMMAKLQQEAAEAATQEAFCNEERGKSTKSKEEKEQALAKTNARLEKAQSATATLAEQIGVLSKEVAEVDTQMKEATEIRNGERAIFVKIEKDLSESVEACGAAIQVLRDYYEGSASLLQAGFQVKLKTHAKAKDGSGILGVLEFASADFEKQLSDVKVAEREKVDNFAKLSTDSKMARAMKEVEIKAKQSESKSLKTAINDYSEDKEGVSAELQAVVDYLGELKPKCEADAPPSYAEKKAARDAEIQGLKEALKILE